VPAPAWRNLSGMAEQETEELSTEQVKRELVERERAKHAELEAEEQTATRRADKAAYLREKLAERAESEEG
jgi:hypothetical protein